MIFFFSLFCECDRSVGTLADDEFLKWESLERTLKYYGTDWAFLNGCGGGLQDTYIIVSTAYVIIVLCAHVKNLVHALLTL